ncbi:GntR family transcriptional regulator [Streptomyces sp. NPDC001292]|uniref:GntR family transcriptional regulator n=1 Tax=Streptomyces sp. NPDC001292 TaxID=3364558 RepID=UPI0036A3C7A7
MSEEQSTAGVPEPGDVAAEAVADRLRERISRGELPPGLPLRDAALAAELGVSRNTLREAVRLLVHEGLAVHRLYKGAAVKRLDVADVHDIYAARRCFELRAVEESVYASEEALAALEERVSAQEAAARAGRWSEVSTWSLDFHRAVVRLLGSRRLDRFFDTIVAQLRLAFAEVPREPEFQAQWVPRDREVCDLLRTGRRAQAAEALRRYLEDSERAVVDMVRAAAARRET